MTKDLIAKSIRELQRAALSIEEFAEIITQLYSVADLHKIGSYFKDYAKRHESIEHFENLISSKYKVSFGDKAEYLKELNKNLKETDINYTAFSCACHSNRTIFNEAKGAGDLSTHTIDNLAVFLYNYSEKYLEFLIGIKREGRHVFSQLYGIRLETEKEKNLRISRLRKQRTKDMERLKQIEKEQAELKERLGI